MPESMILSIQKGENEDCLTIMPTIHGKLGWGNYNSWVIEYSQNLYSLQIEILDLIASMQANLNENRIYKAQTIKLIRKSKQIMDIFLGGSRKSDNPVRDWFKNASSRTNSQKNIEYILELRFGENVNPIFPAVMLFSEVDRNDLTTQVEQLFDKIEKKNCIKNPKAGEWLLDDIAISTNGIKLFRDGIFNIAYKSFLGCSLCVHHYYEEYANDNSKHYLVEEKMEANILQLVDKVVVEAPSKDLPESTELQALGVCVTEAESISLFEQKLNSLNPEVIHTSTKGQFADIGNGKKEFRLSTSQASNDFSEWVNAYTFENYGDGNSFVFFNSCVSGAADMHAFNLIIKLRSKNHAGFIGLANCVNLSLARDFSRSFYEKFLSGGTMFRAFSSTIQEHVENNLSVGSLAYSLWQCSHVPIFFRKVL